MYKRQPALASSFQKTEIGEIPPDKFKSIAPSFSPLQEIGLTVGLIKKIGCSIETVTCSVQLFPSVTVAI